MIRTYTLECSLPNAEADALNQESGRLYTLTLLWHYRVYRRTGRWLSPSQAQKLGDFLGGPTTLHAHSRDAAQQAFYRACQIAKACKARGLPHHYPRHRKRFRTTIWKNTGIRVRAGRLLLSRARGLSPVCVPLPAPLLFLPPSAFLEARLVWDRASRRYNWHLVVEEGATPAPPPGTRVAAVDLGEIHPAALTDGEAAVVVTARALRSTKQYTAKRLSQIQARASRQKPGSRRARRLKRRKARFLAQQKRRVRDIEHKVSRAVVSWAEAHGVGRLAIGDVRDIAHGKRLKAKEQ
jgi:putative transposase